MKAIEQNGFIFEMESYKKLGLNGGYESARFNEIVSLDVQFADSIKQIEFKNVNESDEYIKFEDRILDMIIEIKQDKQISWLTYRNNNLNIIFKISFLDKKEAVRFANHILYFKLHTLNEHMNKYLIK